MKNVPLMPWSRSWHKLREEIGELAKSEDDVMIYAMFPDLGREYLKQRDEGTLQPESSATTTIRISSGKSAR